MHENTIPFLLSNHSYSPALSFDFEENLSPSKGRIVSIDENNDSIEMYLSLTSDLNAVIENFDNLDFLNMKFHELRKKELDNKITQSEKMLLYEVIEKRILEFPNPYLPKNNKKTEEIKSKYLLLEKKIDRKYKTKKRNRLFNIISSWLD